MLKDDRALRPLMLLGALAVVTGGAMLEALLFRGLFDIGAVLNLPVQRLAAAVALLGFVATLLAFRIPVVAESLRIGRRFDALLRMELLRKLPRLADRYFQSRPIPDMADRAHNIHLTRNVPGVAINFVQTLLELALPLVGVILIAPDSAIPALCLAGFALATPALVQPMVNERDLRVRNHAGALNGFYLDTLLGLTPVRTHRAERSIRHQHESLLVEWARSSYRLVRASIVANAIQSVGTVGLASFLLLRHFMSIGGVTGADLLLIYWTLKLPATASALTALAHQYPMQRNALLRLMEPLTAPEDVSSEHMDQPHDRVPIGKHSDKGVEIRISGGEVLAAGRTILRDINLSIAAGEHVAIVGLSGAGKSTLVGLLLGWRALSQGRLDVDGVELTPARVEHLRRRTAWVDPAVQIWNKSFLDNLGYSADDPGFAGAAAALDGAHLRGLLRKLPDGLQSCLGEGGALLSGGEGQRVRLGRTLMQDDVRLALLDEPFRGLDREQRSLFLTQARARWAKATLLCVTHDVAETRAFDRVMVIEDGHIIEDGSPARLLARPSRYRELVEAERDVRARMWAGTQWRHLSMRDGLLYEAAE